MDGPLHHWRCPGCGAEDQTREREPHMRMHRCRAARGLEVPLLPDRTKAKLVVVEREDYVGGEDVRLDPELGRPVQAVLAVRDDGQDCTVYAPCAHASMAEVR